MTSSNGQAPPASPHRASEDGRGSDDTSTPARRVQTKGPRYLYYRVYTTEGAIESQNPIYSDDRSISRILTKSVAPPHIASTLKKYLCKIEGFPGAENASLYETLLSQTVIPDSTRISLLEHSGIGSSEDNPAVLVVESREVKERAGNAVNSKELPEATTAMETHCVYYRVYDGVGEAISKTHFDEDDPSLGRVAILSIAPPRIVCSLKARLVNAEDHPGDDIQLFEDAGSDSPMGDTDVLTFLGENYPGSTEEQPIAVVFKKIAIVNAPQPQPPAFSKKIRARITENYKHYPTNWLPITAGEVFLTDGIAIQHPGFPHDEHRFKGYMASNSAGQTGFVGDYASEFC